MNLPSHQQTETFLQEAADLNPGPWVAHSRYVGQAATAIASRHPRLDPEVAFRLGCLHDIGRRVGVTDMRHALDGYLFLRAQGFEDAARVCLTHSFPINGVASVAGQWDCTPDELQFVDDYIDRIEMNEYDRLIQLCDAIALPSGFCLMEKRLIDVALRRGVNEYSVARWKAYMGIQQTFEHAIGQSLYEILPGVVENTFGLNQGRSQPKTGAPFCHK